MDGTALMVIGVSSMIPRHLLTAVLDDLFEIISLSWLLNFIETRHASFDTSDITNYIEITVLDQSCQNQFIC